MALFVGMGHDLAEVVRVHGVEDVEEVLTRRSFILGILVREIAVHGRIFLELRPQGLGGQLFIMRHLILLEQLLLASQDVLEEVLVDKRLWW